ncbi:hypothetical protein [Rhizobium sp. CECT 9324]|uniref:hypothetical protein n=1 Tax=Rhizobium sp. CECT 9324 TaxID=2845820 RepID=UPI001E4C9C34|nr:hypothetical protein [Rhizobium sp. CECT 9324]CAH0340833.1 hypothetical protein RHI9324_02515 [Rhizobium sp. CECT 9324]
MTATSYTTYVGRLKNLYVEILANPDSVESALIEIIIYRNGYGHKAIHRVAGGKVAQEGFTGEIVASAWAKAPVGAVLEEIDRFFALGMFYAYSDEAFIGDKGPFSTAHWDATLAEIKFSYSRSGRSTLMQRMLFVGFTDEIHAEFSLAVDQGILVQDHADGLIHYEWRVTKVANNPSALSDPSGNQVVAATPLPEVSLQKRPKPAPRQWLRLLQDWVQRWAASFR